MSLSKRLRNSGEKRAQGDAWVGPLIPGRPPVSDVSGVYVDSETAMRISAVFACVRLRSGTIASLPVGAYVRRGRVRLSYAAAYGETPQWLIKPNPEQTRLEFFEQMITSMDLRGDAFILTVRDDNDDVIEVYVLNPDKIRIIRRAGEPVFYEYKEERTREVVNLTSRDILHIPSFLLPGETRGRSPIEACRLVVGGALAAETYAASYFGNAANPGGVIEVPGELDQEQVSDLAINWNIAHSGPYKAGKMGILTGGASFKPLSINAADAQLLEARKFGVEEIARIFNVPISLLGHPVAGAMSFASVEAQNLSFVQHSLRPLLERIEQALSTILPEPDAFIRFNLDALLRGTTIERFDAYTKGLREGFMSLNDVRSMEDMPPIEDGDQYRVPLQNIDAKDAKDVGLNLRTEIIAKLIQVGFDPADVLSVIGMEAIKHTGVPSTQLQQISTIDPGTPQAAYEVNSRSFVDVNVPDTIVNVPETRVNVESPEVNVAAPNVTVEPAVINIQNVEQRKRIVRKVIRDENNRVSEIIEQTIEDDE
jgi:HK97 family phage portal protein